MENKNFKDSIFRLLFGENKEHMLELYNALNNSNYHNKDDIEITTLKDAFYVNFKNDVSFLIDGNLSLWEQQATYNPNMPIRGLIYYAKILSMLISRNSKKIYSNKEFSIPYPQYIVFYNGKDKRPEYEEMKLSDLFINKDISQNGKYEFSAMVYNINEGYNLSLLNKCPTLNGYMTLVNKNREYHLLGDSNEQAIIKAVDYCIENNILKDFLTEKRAEVIEMGIFEITIEDFLDVRANDARDDGLQEGLQKGISIGKAEGKIEGKAEGIIEGKAKGIIEGKAEGIIEGKAKGALEKLVELYTKGILDLITASKEANMSEKAFLKLVEKKTN